MVLNVVTFPVDLTKQMLNKSVKERNVFHDLFDNKGCWKSILIKNLHHCAAWSIFTVLSRLMNLHKSLQTLPNFTALKTTHSVVILFPML